MSHWPIGRLGWAPLLLVLLLAGACIQPPAPLSPPTPDARLYDLDLATLSARLATVDSLQAAAADLAGAAAVPAGDVWILMRTETCASCAQASGQSGALAELTVAEATPLLMDGAAFWLTVPPLACLYTLAGPEIRPQGCRTQ